MKKVPKLKPLQISDVMVALIKQEHSQDQLPDYKAFLGQRRYSRIEAGHDTQEGLRLPQFATKQMSDAEILNYHIQRRITDTSENEAALRKLDERIRNVMAEYSGKLREGEEAIEELARQVARTCRTASGQRGYLKGCIKQMKKHYGSVVSKMHKINNITKVIHITKIWTETKLPYLLSAATAHPPPGQMRELLLLFDSAIRRITQDPHFLGPGEALKTVLASLQDRRNSLIRGAHHNFTQAIVRFTNVAQYKAKYQQYMLVRDMGLCEDVLTEEGLAQLLTLNAKDMFYEILTRITPSANLDILSEVAYLDFFNEVTEEYVMYFRSWHLATTFHLDAGTPYGRLFLAHRKQVFVVLSEKLSSCLASSNKFIALEYGVKLGLLQKLEDYMEAGQEWMGRCQGISLPRVVTAKLKKELENIFGLYNNLIKNVLTQELSVMALESADSPTEPPKSQVIEDIEINYQKISMFLHRAGDQVNARLPLPQTTKLHKPPPIRLKIGCIFIEMISEYLERAKYLETDKSIYMNKIIEHFQFIFFILYQVAIRDVVRAQVTEDVAVRVHELPSEEVNLKTLDKLAREMDKKKKYSGVLDFIGSVGRKYDGVRVAGIIDVNKIFNSGSGDIIKRYTNLVVRVCNELVIILKWVVEVVPCSALKGHRRAGELARLQDTLLLLFGLMLENNMEAMGHKYIESISPIIGRLKWEVKKFNAETAGLFKEYKMKAMEIFRNNTLLSLVRSEAPVLAGIVEDQEAEVLYRSLLECYGRIEKINDNGRQLIRMDSLEVTKILHEIGVNCPFWATWLERYLDFTSERSSRTLLDKVKKVVCLYPPLCWKYHMMWVVADFSYRERKEYSSQLSNIYLQFLKEE